MTKVGGGGGGVYVFDLPPFLVGSGYNFSETVFLCVSLRQSEMSSESTVQRVTILKQ